MQGLDHNPLLPYQCGSHGWIIYCSLDYCIWIGYLDFLLAAFQLPGSLSISSPPGGLLDYFQPQMCRYVQYMGTMSKIINGVWVGVPQTRWLGHWRSCWVVGFVGFLEEGFVCLCPCFVTWVDAFTHFKKVCLGVISGDITLPSNCLLTTN